VNGVTKCLTAKFYPNKVLICLNNFFLWFFGQFKPFLYKSETTLLKQFFLHNFFCFLFQAPGYLDGVTYWKTSKRALVPLLPGEMKLDLPDSKTFEEPFCLRLNFFQERGGGVYLIPKMKRNFFLFLIGHFSSKI
jgi:hypothetical protein